MYSFKLIQIMSHLWDVCAYFLFVICCLLTLASWPLGKYINADLFFNYS